MTLVLTSAQKQRRARNERHKPAQLDMFGEPPASPPAPVAQSPRAAKIAADDMMRNEARRALSEKAAGKAKAPVSKPKVQKCKS